jgi:hypothetical protein
LPSVPLQRWVRPAKSRARTAALKHTDGTFADVETDCHKEFWDAVRIGEFETAEAGLAEITHRRTYSQPKPPEKAISCVFRPS